MVKYMHAAVRSGNTGRSVPMFHGKADHRVQTLIFAFMMTLLCILPVRAQEVHQSREHVASFPEDEVYNTEISAFAEYRRTYGAGDPPNEYRTYGADILYSFHPLAHNMRYRTDASRMVLPKSMLQAGVQSGPVYADGPADMKLRVAGAGLLSDRVGVGGVLRLERSRWEDRLVTELHRDVGIGALIDIHVSPGVALREVLILGESEIDFGHGYPSSTFSTLRFEHTLVARIGEDSGYRHTFRYHRVSDVYTSTELNQFFEYAPTEVFSVVPQLHLGLRMYERPASCMYAALGMAAVISFTPRHVLHLLPLYEIEHVQEDAPSFSLRAGFAMRM